MYQLIFCQDLRAPEQRGSHISACFRDRKIEAYFTVIFDAVIGGNPIPYGSALVTSGTDPRFLPHFCRDYYSKLCLPQNLSA